MMRGAFFAFIPLYFLLLRASHCDHVIAGEVRELPGPRERRWTENTIRLTLGDSQSTDDEDKSENETEKPEQQRDPASAISPAGGGSLPFSMPRRRLLRFTRRRSATLRSGRQRAGKAEAGRGTERESGSSRITRVSVENGSGQTSRRNAVRDARAHLVRRVSHKRRHSVRQLLRRQQQRHRRRDIISTGRLSSARGDRRGGIGQRRQTVQRRSRQNPRRRVRQAVLRVRSGQRRLMQALNNFRLSLLSYQKHSTRKQRIAKGTSSEPLNRKLLLRQASSGRNMNNRVVFNRQLKTSGSALRSPYRQARIQDRRSLLDSGLRRAVRRNSKAAVLDKIRMPSVRVFSRLRMQKQSSRRVVSNSRAVRARHQHRAFFVVSKRAYRRQNSFRMHPWQSRAVGHRRVVNEAFRTPEVRRQNRHRVSNIASRRGARSLVGVTRTRRSGSEAAALRWQRMKSAMREATSRSSSRRTASTLSREILTNARRTGRQIAKGTRRARRMRVAQRMTSSNRLARQDTDKLRRAVGHNERRRARASASSRRLLAQTRRQTAPWSARRHLETRLSRVAGSNRQRNSGGPMTRRIRSQNQRIAFVKDAPAVLDSNQYALTTRVAEQIAKPIQSSPVLDADMVNDVKTTSAIYLNSATSEIQTYSSVTSTNQSSSSLNSFPNMDIQVSLGYPNAKPLTHFSCLKYLPKLPTSYKWQGEVSRALILGILAFVGIRSRKDVQSFPNGVSSLSSLTQHVF